MSNGDSFDYWNPWLHWINRDIRQFLGVAVPSISEVGAGYDALVQFRDDLVASTLIENMGKSLDVFIAPLPLSPDVLPDLVQQAIEDVLADGPPGSTGPIINIGNPAGLPAHSVGMFASHVEGHLRPGRLSLTPGNTIGTLEIDIEVRVVWEQSDEALEFIQRLVDHFGLPGLGLRDVDVQDIAPQLTRFVTSGSVRLDVQLEPVNGSSAFEVGATGTFGRVYGETGSDLFLSLYENSLGAKLQAFMDQRFGDRPLQATPRISLTGRIHRQLELPNRIIQLESTTTTGNDPDHGVLTLAISTNRRMGGETGDVRPFTGANNFGIYLHKDFVNDLLSAIWNKSSTRKTFKARMPTLLLVDDVPTDASVLLDIELQTRSDPTLAPNIEDPESDVEPGDPVEVNGVFHETLVELSVEGRLIPFEDVEDLGDAASLLHQQSVILQFHPFDRIGSRLENRDTERFTASLGRTLTDPFVNPSTDRRLLNRTGEGSHMSGIIVRGDLQ